MRVRRLLFIVFVLCIGVFIWHLMRIEIGYSKRLEVSDKFYQEDMVQHMEEANSTYHILNKTDDVEVLLNQQVYKASDKMIFTIKNNGFAEAVFGTVYSIEIYKNDQWYVVPFQDNIAFNSLAYIVKGQSKVSQNVSLNVLYRPLKKGRYRFIKVVNGDYYSTEFEVVN